MIKARSLADALVPSFSNCKFGSAESLAFNLNDETLLLCQLSQPPSSRNREGLSRPSIPLGGLFRIRVGHLQRHTSLLATAVWAFHRWRCRGWWLHRRWLHRRSNLLSTGRDYEGVRVALEGK